MTSGSPLEQQRRHINLFRAFEAAALAGTVTALIVTYVLLGLTATEQNPAASYLIETFGWHGAGAIAIASVAVSFAFCRRLASLWSRRLGLGLAAVVASISLLNAANDLVVLTISGVPQSLRLGTMEFVGFLALAALLVFARTELIALWRVAPPLPRATRTVVTVGISVLLVVSIIGPGVIMLPGIEADHDGTAAAAQSDDGQEIVYAGEYEDINAYYANGTQLWHSNYATSTTVAGIGIGPSGDYIYASGGTSLWKYHAGNGTTVWTNDTAFGSNAGQTEVDPHGYVYAVSSDNALTKFNPDGTQNWTVGLDNNGNGVTISSDGSKIYASTASSTYSFNPDGTQNWNVGQPAEFLEIGPDDKYLYWGESADYGQMYADDGSAGWANSHSKAVEGMDLAQDGSTLYIGSFLNSGSGYVIAADTADGSTKWTSDRATDRVYGVGANIENTNVAYGSSDNTLYVENTADQSLNWSKSYTDYPFTVEYSTDYTGVSTGDPVTGTVTDSAGNAVSDATVSADHPDVDSVTTASDGSYELTVPDPADYNITADNGTYSLTKTVSVPDGGTTEDFQLGLLAKGTVEDLDGNPIENATVSVGDSNRSATTDSGGNYEVAVPSPGSYNLTATKDGYETKTQTVDIQGETPVSYELEFLGDFNGQVVGCAVTDLKCEDPTPVGGATVEVWGVDHQSVEDHFDDVTSAEEAEQKAQELITDAETVEPPDWQSDLKLLGEGGTMSSAEQPYVAVHTESDWGLSGWTDSPDLRPPRLEADPGQVVVLSAWDPAEQDLVQDGVNKHLPGETMDGETIVIEQLGPGGDEVTDRRELELDANKQGYEVGVIRPNRHAYVSTTLPEGYYRVSVKGSSVSYVLKVGDPFVGIVSDLEDEAGNLVDQAQEVQDWLDQGILERQSIKTDTNGRFAVEFDNDRVETIAGYGYKADGQLDPTSSRSMLKQVQDSRAQNAYNGSVAIPRDPVQVDVPASNVQLRTTELSSEPFSDLEGLSDRVLAQLAEFLDSTPSEIEGVWNIPSEEWDNVVDDPTNVGGGGGSDSVDDATNYLQNRYEQMVSLAEETGAVEGDEPEWWSHRDEVPEDRGVLLSRISDLQTAIEYESPSSQPDPEPPDVSEGELQAIFPFNGDVDPDTVDVTVQWSDGTMSPVNESYYSIEETMSPWTGDRVVIEGYPIPEGKAVGDVHVDAAVDDSAVKSRAGFQNPAYTGDVPAFRSIDVSTTHPGPSDTVRVNPRPRTDTGYGELTGVTAYGPDGAVESRVLDGNESAQFSTNGAGDYTVQLDYKAQDGTPFVERFTLQAGEQSASVPPTVKAQSAIGGGHYAIAGSGLRDASIEADEKTGRTQVTATIPADGSISELHVQARSAMSGDELSVNVVQGSDQRTVRNHVAVVIHEDLSDDSLVWRDNREPITRSGETQFGDIEELDGEKDLIRSYTDSRGQLDMTIKQDPGWWDRRAHGFWSNSLVRSIGSFSLPISIGPLSTVLGWFGGLPVTIQIGGPMASMAAAGVAVSGRASS